MQFSKELCSTHRINSSSRNIRTTRLILYRQIQSILQHLFPRFRFHESSATYKDSQASSHSTHRNGILSNRQHPHRPYKIPQVHFYRILQGELGFFQKGLSIALSCSTKVSDFRNSLSYCFLHIELFYKKIQEK